MSFSARALCDRCRRYQHDIFHVGGEVICFGCYYSELFAGVRLSRAAQTRAAGPGGGTDVKRCPSCGAKHGRRGPHCLRCSPGANPGRVYGNADTLNRRLVAGETMGRSTGDFAEACAHYIESEQEKPLPDNALIALLCDAVRLCREYEALATR